MAINIDSLSRRLRSLSEPRFGVSLIAGKPFSKPFTSAVQALQLRLTDLIPGDLVLPDPADIHVTIFRGKSSLNQCLPTLTPPTEIDAVLTGIRPVTLIWNSIILEQDGAIRAYSQPSAWPFVSMQNARFAVKAIESYSGRPTSIQQRLWATLGTIRTDRLDADTISRVQTLLNDSYMPEISIFHLKLIYYKDIHLSSAEIIKSYELR